VLRLASGPVSAILLAVDVAAVATGADQHLRAAAGAQKKPPSCIPLLGLVTQTWTKRATGGILPRHTCSARCGARRRYELRKVGIGAAPVLNEDRGFSAPSPALGVATSPDASEIGRTSRRSARSAEQQETDPQVKVRSLQWPPKLFPPTVNARERRIPPAIHTSIFHPEFCTLRLLEMMEKGANTARCGFADSRQLASFVQSESRW
jgi:hypothetical protein